MATKFTPPAQTGQESFGGNFFEKKIVTLSCQFSIIFGNFSIEGTANSEHYKLEIQQNPNIFFCNCSVTKQILLIRQRIFSEEGHRKLKEKILGR